MKPKIAIVGAGMGGLTAAIRLRQKGHAVAVFEAGPAAGGLASGVQAGNTQFDGGPYILLDRPGLEWAFSEIGLDLAQLIPMVNIERIYEVTAPDSAGRIRIFHSLEATIDDLEKVTPGSGRAYGNFVEKMKSTYNRLTPLQRKSQPSLWKLISHGAWRDIPFLLKPLQKVLADAGITGTLKEALGIWTHIAGQKLDEAPSPLALISGVIHQHGCFLPTNGIREVPARLTEHAKSIGVEFHFGAAVKRIETENGGVTGVRLVNGILCPIDQVISNASGVGTYAELLSDSSPQTDKLLSLPLQSPGYCIYLLCKGQRPEFYLRFQLKDHSCQVFVSPESVLPHQNQDWWPARIIRPLKHGSLEEQDFELQNDLITKTLKEDWWKQGISEYRVVHTRTTFDWASAFRLFRSSMNPVMTAKFMRMGRIPHRSPTVKGLYHVGSSTHPGQWVSFAAISGILAADSLMEDLD